MTAAAVYAVRVSDPQRGRRLGRAVAELEQIGDPLLRLDAVRAARETLDALEARTVRESRAAGATWSAIGRLYGLTKQGAQQRFGVAAKPAAD